MDYLDSQLTSLELRQLLEASALLETLVLEGGVLSTTALPPDAWTGRRVPLHSLRSLILKDFFDANTLSYVIQLLDIPNLRELTLADCTDTSGAYLNCFTPLQELRSPWIMRNKIEYLKLDHIEFRGWPNPLCNVYGAMIGLKWLHIVCPSVKPRTNDPDYDEERDKYGKAFNHLVGFFPSERGGPFFPKFEELTTSGVPGSLLVEIAEIRQERRVPIPSIVYDRADRLNESYVRRLHQLGVRTEEYAEDSSDGEEE